MTRRKLSGEVSSASGCGLINEAHESVEIDSMAIEETRSLGRLCGELLEPGDVVLLSGELGAGKTELVRGLAVGLGVDPAEVRSPTFTLINHYPGGRCALVHVDAYRLGGPIDLIDLGLEQVLDASWVSAIEWADRVREALPADVLTIEASHKSPEARCYKLSASGAHYGSVVATLRQHFSQE